MEFRRWLSCAGRKNDWSMEESETEAFGKERWMGVAWVVREGTTLLLLLQKRGRGDRKVEGVRAMKEGDGMM